MVYCFGKFVKFDEDGKCVSNVVGVRVSVKSFDWLKIPTLTTIYDLGVSFSVTVVVLPGGDNIQKEYEES